MNRLEEIVMAKRDEVKALRPFADKFHREAIERNEVRPFRSVLKGMDGQLALIAEIKRASPSAGTIVDSFSPAEIARKYEDGGASALSVLTDTKFFQGELADLMTARDAVSLPILRKDFIVDEVQVAQAGAAGADAILLIVAALEQSELVALSEAAAKYQLDVLVEVHSPAEMERALEADAAIVGINNRDLTTFAIDLSVTERLSEEVPNDVVLVSESGIRTPADVRRMKDCGVNAVLVGEALMRDELSVETILNS